MLEGLWVVRFLKPSAEEFDLLSGVVVVETNRILGGDSGYIYVGQIHEKNGEAWPVHVRLKKHDDRIEGFFNDSDEYDLTGNILPDPNSEGNLLIVLGQAEQMEMILSMTKAAELP